MTHEPVRRQRDLRLDFFRGIAMFIILIAHIPNNAWALWIPARFGPSDAAEMFVFCSGFASAIAFGSVFLERGPFLGTVRVLLRCFQVYWAHLGMFMAVASAVVIGTRAGGAKDYVGTLNLHPFFNDPMSGLVGLMSLTYVPNYFDILPMYLVLLFMVPVVAVLARLHPYLAVSAILGLWLANQVWDFQLPAEWWSDRPWFFDPFGWVLIFFTGFALSAGWVRAPARKPWLMVLAAVFVLALVPLSYWPIYSKVAWLEEIRRALWPGFEKTNFGLLRWLHFLALGYLAIGLLRGRERILDHPALRPVIRVGQQALATFVTSMVLAQIVGMLLDHVGRSMVTVPLANLAGFACLIATAYLVRYFKGQPWRRPAPPTPAPQAAAPDRDRAAVGVPSE